MSEPTAAELAEKLRDAYNNFEADAPQTLELFTDDVVYRDPRFPAFEGKEALKTYLNQVAGETRRCRSTGNIPILSPMRIRSPSSGS